MTGRDFEWRQYRLLLRLLRDLGSRRELTSQFGLDTNALTILGGGSLLLGGLVSLFAFANPPAREYLLVCLALTAFAVLPILVADAADAFLNPAEVSVLAHRPVRSLTYLAAKATYVVRTTLAIALPLNLLPALTAVSLAETRWFYPFTHLLAVALASVFTALVMCGVFGVVLRILPIAKVRSAALWVQLVSVTIVPVAPQLSRFVDVDVDLDAPIWSALPVVWFAAVGLAGQDGRPVIHPLVALPSMLLSVVAIGFGVRALTRDYLIRVATLMRTRSRSVPRRAQGWAGPLAAWVTGNQAGRGGTTFVTKMAARDWHFRREFLRGTMAIVIPMGILIVSRGATSPFASGRFSPIHLLPHFIGLVLIGTAQTLAFTNHHQAAWVFQTVPASGLRGVVRGAWWSLWGLGIGVPYLVAFALTVQAWDLRDALVFTAYSLAVSSFYLGAGVWLLDGLPFAKPPNPARASAAIGVMMWFLALAGALALVQRFVIFRHFWIVPVATLIFAAAAWFATRVSLRILENRARDSLAAMVEARSRMFASSSDR